MQIVEALHHEAMELVDRAILARQCGDIDRVTALTRAAFAKERAAADLVDREFVSLNSTTISYSDFLRSSNHR